MAGDSRESKVAEGTTAVSFLKDTKEWKAGLSSLRILGKCLDWYKEKGAPELRKEDWKQHEGWGCSHTENSHLWLRNTSAKLKSSHSLRLQCSCYLYLFVLGCEACLFLWTVWGKEPWETFPFYNSDSKATNNSTVHFLASVLSSISAHKYWLSLGLLCNW